MAQQKPQKPPAPQWIKVSPEVAATHLLKKAKPMYPPFARAAGIEGVVRVGIDINEQGGIDAVSGATGWACLREAARSAVARYRYKPFEKDGHPVLVETSVDVVFKLPRRNKAALPPPPADFDQPGYLHSLDWREPDPQIPPRLRKILVPYLLRLCHRYGLDGHIARSERGELFYQEITFREIPTEDTSTALYIMMASGAPWYSTDESRDLTCGGNGNCPIQIVSVTSRGVRLIAKTSGGGFHAYAYRDSPHPEIFVASNPGGLEVSCAGYVNIAGSWGLLYCGKTVGHKTEIHLCR